MSKSIVTMYHTKNPNMYDAHRPVKKWIDNHIINFLKYEQTLEYLEIPETYEQFAYNRNRWVEVAHEAYERKLKI